eukprot:gene13846-13967_t
MKATRRGTFADLNIWTWNNENLGYATLPFSNQGNRDGVVCRPDTFPGGGMNRFNLGDTTVHEVGHWLGLYHTFQGGCSGNGDEVADTPAVATANWGCPSVDSCPSLPGRDLVNNYMDYTDDSCMDSFTGGQAQRMRSIWATYRAPAGPPPVENRMVPQASTNLCVDAPTWNNMEQVFLYNCHGGGNQRFERLPDGSLRFTGNPNKCLDVAGSGTTAGTKVQVYDCNGTPAQRWSRDENGSLRPACAPNMCLDIPSGNMAVGNRLQLWSCNNSPAQKWTPNLVPTVARDSISIGPLCVDAPSWNNGARLYLFGCHGGSNQRFVVRSNGALQFPGTNKCMDVRNAGTTDGTWVQVWDCNGNPAQRWSRDSNNALRPANAPSKCLDIPNSNSVQGTQLQIWGCNNSGAQRFRADFLSVTARALAATGGVNSTWPGTVDGSVSAASASSVDSVGIAAEPYSVEEVTALLEAQSSPSPAESLLTADVEPSPLP